MGALPWLRWRPSSSNPLVDKGNSAHSIFKYFQTHAGGVTLQSFFLSNYESLEATPAASYGGLVNRSKSLTAFTTIDRNHPCLRFSGRGSPLLRSSWASNFKSACSRGENNSKHLGQLAHAISGSEEKTIKHQYHSIGKQRHVGSHSELDEGFPTSLSGACHTGPCRQGCNLTASQHSLKCHFYVWLWQCRTWVSTKRITRCGGCTCKDCTSGCANRIGQNVAEPEVTAPLTLFCCFNQVAAKQLGMCIRNTLSSPVTAFTNVMSCMDNFNSRLRMLKSIYVSKVNIFRPPCDHQKKQRSEQSELEVTKAACAMEKF